MFETNIGKTSVKLLGGIGEIGGNCVVIQGDGTYILDQGIRFSVFGKYFGGYLKPKGVSELRRLGVLPDLSSYDEALALITHLHLDHTGLLSNLPPGTRLYVPDTYSVFIEWYKKRSDWLAFMTPRAQVNVDFVEPLTQFGKIKAYRVRHSAYPAYAYLYDDGESRILYTGDIRVESPLWYADRATYYKVYGNSVLTDLDEAIDVDLLIIEGTNYSGRSELVTAEHLVNILSEVLNVHNKHSIVVSIDHMDLDLFLTVSSLVVQNGKSIILASDRLSDMANYWAEKGLLSEEVMKNSYYPGENEEMLEELLRMAVKNPEKYVVFSSVDDLIEMIRSIFSDNQSPKVLISMEAEGGAEAGSLYDQTAEWLSLGNVITYRLRLSGHYYPYQLGEILKVVKPKKILPIHTEEPEAVCMHAKSIDENIECIIPT